MCDSDSDSDGEFCPDDLFGWRDAQHSRRYKAHGSIIPLEEHFAQWFSISKDLRQRAAQRMKVCSFWLPILLQRDESSPYIQWATVIGLIDSADSEELNLRNLQKIEVVEAIFRTMDRACLEREKIENLIWFNSMFKWKTPDLLDKALCWMEDTGEPFIRRRMLELDTAHQGFLALTFIFAEYSTFIRRMCEDMDQTLASLMAAPAEHLVEKSEEMKLRGNDNYKKNEYKEAVKCYSRAIHYYPDNHFLYGNRALCYIRCKKYLKATFDGKRAVLINPYWAKGHYRYCEALYLVGKRFDAIEANASAQTLCEDDSEGLKDLQQQHHKFLVDLGPNIEVIEVGRPMSKSRRADGPNKADRTVKNVKPAVSASASAQTKVSEKKADKTSGKNMTTVLTNNPAHKTKPSKSSSNNCEVDPSTSKKKAKNKKPDQPEVKNHKVLEKAAVCKELKSVVQDARGALEDLRFRYAEQTFRQAVLLLQPHSQALKDLDLCNLDFLLLFYGRTSALIEIGQPQELMEAQKLVKKMESYEERTFQCLVFYASGRIYLKENRFALALEHFSDSLRMVRNKITPGKLTWPLTTNVVKETQPEYFEEILEGVVSLCKYPPTPDAVCRLEKCHSSIKAEIYLSDPDFKGYIHIACCQKCSVQFHISCWKTLKTSRFSEKNEKEFLHDACLTPDCVGQICSIKIIGPTGLVKSKSEVNIPKPQAPKKTKVNQKCTSLKKLKQKADHKLKRKQHQHSFQEQPEDANENLQQNHNSAAAAAAATEHKAWLVYRDRVLLQLSQKMELLREEKNLHVSALVSSMKPWLELDSRRGNPLAEKMLAWQQESLETLGQVVEILLERNNRVWARVLVELLSSSTDVNHKLNTWACQLNDSGLNAAKSFIDQHSELLEELDLGRLLDFGPLQEEIIEKLGTRPELFSSIGLTVTEYLKQAPAQHMRLFIWTLEEHRADYLSCHAILDEYFDMMDVNFMVLKKTDESLNNSPMKTKSRGRKKKREPKGGFVLRSETPADEWDREFYEDDSLSLLHEEDPFSVPSHLQQQVADFEEQYNGGSHGACYKSVLDNKPDPAKESLFDYFAQILKEHGSLRAEDRLLVGELQYFPPDAQQKIQDAGGLEAFLLESPRFTKVGRNVGLTRSDVSPQPAPHAASLDDLDEIVDPNSAPGLHQAAFPVYTFPYPHVQVYPAFPNPYSAHFHPACQSVGGVPVWHHMAPQQPIPYYFPANVNEVDPAGQCMVREPDSGDDAHSGAADQLTLTDASVQTCQENMSSVAVNTEPHERFERCPGEINKQDKRNKQLEQEIHEMTNNGVDHEYKDELGVLQDDIQKINDDIQVTNDELTLLQQKLEEEVKRDQKEKKANQDALKALKQEKDELLLEHGSLTRNIQENKKLCEMKTSDFLELGNQSAAEKMSLEDEIKRCNTLVAMATRRSHKAHVAVMESRHQVGLNRLNKDLTAAQALLSKVDEAVHRYPYLEVTRNNLGAEVQDLKKKISIAEAQFKGQQDQVRNGRRISELSINNSSEAPTPQVEGAAAAAPAPPPPAAAVAKRPTRKTEAPPTTIFDKAMERLSSIFPDTSRPELMRFVQLLRSSSGGSLNNMTSQDLVEGVTQLILDYQDRNANVARPAPGATPPPSSSASAWQPLASNKSKFPKALNEEDPCIICHEDMNPEDVCVLECRHSFHKDCIQSWLKEQSTCPTCRDHALLPEDFPALKSHRRKAP